MSSTSLPHTTDAVRHPLTAGATLVARASPGAESERPAGAPPLLAREASRPTLPDTDEAATALALLPDATLLATVCTLTARSNATLAALLAHLGEVGARGLHRERACSSLYTYCVYELRMSEDTAFRRARAAELVRRFPATFTAIARGELHLTGLLQLGPHLTEANVSDLLARARYRTRREIAALVAPIAPRPDAPALLEPLGPEPARGVRAPTHAEFTASLMGPVRTLPAGRAPADWLEVSLVPGPHDEAVHDDGGVNATVSARTLGEARPGGGAHASDGVPSGDDERRAPDRDDPVHAASTPALRYRLQFTVSEAYVELLREVQALASHAVAPGDLAALHLRALEALAVTLRQRRHASRTPAGRAVPERRELPGPGSDGTPCDTDPRQRRDGVAPSAPGAPRAADSGRPAGAGARRRYVAAAVRRAVWHRDEGRCTHVDERGRRCPETRWLELHHARAFARGGAATTANLALRCRAHNALASEQDFGREQARRAWRRSPARACDPG